MLHGNVFITILNCGSEVFTVFTKVKSEVTYKISTM